MTAFMYWHNKLRDSFILFAFALLFTTGVIHVKINKRKLHLSMLIFAFDCNIFSPYRQIVYFRLHIQMFIFERYNMDSYYCSIDLGTSLLPKRPACIAI